MNRLYNYTGLFLAALVLLFFVDDDYTTVTPFEWTLLAVLCYSAIEVFRIILRSGSE